ncbi:DUF4174 domain-containing protein [Altibacter sp. HG106]|uniref:DUF4174 domain-containing protein n=1 Tax=Altibacter sp. HG106 TaxID=3023937 RepID=UPI0023505A0B|nr:DUF4174 domain-containing protein [Altibacter sp. HG106]MDC7994206.1 DUF4174 domain-containing protein [Altibacter sp. HG106]
MNAQQFPELQWEHRIICITSETFEDAKATTQIDLVTKDEAGRKERQLLVLHCTDSFCRNALTKASITGAPPKETNGFSVRLIGLDGGVKFSSETPVSLEKFYELIDQMPMRRAEMRTKN